MHVILDTNVIRADLGLRTGPFAILTDYLAKTQSKVLMPRIIYEELQALHRRELEARLVAYMRARGSLNVLIPDTPVQEVAIDLNSASIAYMRNIQERLDFEESDLLEYQPRYLADVIDRAIHRKRPCSDKGEEIRDAVVWLMVLDAARKEPTVPLVFISQNERQFAQDGKLHPDLQAELAVAAVTVHYFTSLDAFVRQHATQVHSITDAWILSVISTDDVLDRCFDVVQEYCHRSVVRTIKHGQKVREFYEITDNNLSLDEFYVYEMANGTHRVEAMYSGEVEMSFHVELAEDEYDWGISPVTGGLEYAPRYYTGDQRFELVTGGVDVMISIDGIIKDGQLTSWDITDIDRI